MRLIFAIAAGVAFLSICLTAALLGCGVYMLFHLDPLGVPVTLTGVLGILAVRPFAHEMFDLIEAYERRNYIDPE